MSTSGALAPPANSGSKRLRRLGVWALAAGIVVPHLGAIALGREVWPVSHYPMYAHRPDADWVELRLYGTPAGGGDERLVLPGEMNVRRIDVRNGLKKIDDPNRLADALAGLLARYEANRAAGRHDGPELSAIAMYRDVWHLDFDRGGGGVARAPDEHELVAAVQADGGDHGVE